MFTSCSKDIQSQLTNNRVIYTPENELPVRYDLKRCCDWIRENNYQKTCLQFPLHLLNDGTSIVMYLQKKLGKPVYVLADTAYGSCCVDEVAAEHVNADSIIHFGHACLSPVMRLPVLYIFEKKDLDMKRLYDSVEILEKNVVIFYDDVFHHLYSELCSLFQNKTEVNVSCLQVNDKKQEGMEIMCGRAFMKSSDKEVSAVYIGEECITLQNLVLGLPDFKWFLYSNESGLVEYSLDLNKFLMQRSHLVEKVREANVLGILIGTLGIKNYLDAADRIQAMAKQNGKKCYILAVGKPSVAKLANFPEIDVFVLIACQENLLLKDFKDYYKPVVSLFEVELALADRPFSVEYTSDFRQLLSGGCFYKEIEPRADFPVEKETSKDVMVKEPGRLIEFGGAQFLANRTWRGLEIEKSEIKVCKASKGRSGIAQGYENEVETLSEGNQSESKVALGQFLCSSEEEKHLF